MKKLISLLLCVVLFLTGCNFKPVNDEPVNPSPTVVEPTINSPEPTESPVEEITSSELTDEKYEEPPLEFTGLDDPELLRYLEDSIYAEMALQFDSDDYIIESVSAQYISKEYLEEVGYNSAENIYFGYSVNTLNDLLQGTKYMFTLGEDGNTIVQPISEVDDSINKQLITNVAIGAGIIIICVVVSVATYGAGAPAAAGAGASATAISMTFAAGAKTAAVCAVSGAAIGGVAAGAVRAYQTGDFNEAMKAGALAASESFKWGAITGAASGIATEALLIGTATKGGLTANEAAYIMQKYNMPPKKIAQFSSMDDFFAWSDDAIRAATANGLTATQVVQIQEESLLPYDVIGQFHNMDEYLVYKSAGLSPQIVNGQTALIQEIDLEYVSYRADGSAITNLQLMRNGNAPFAPLCSHVLVLIPSW